MTKTTISLFVLIATMCGLVLAEECINIKDRNICESTFSHDDLVVAQNFLIEDETTNIDQFVAASIMKEQLVALMTKVGTPAALDALDEYAEDRITDTVSLLTLGSFEAAAPAYLILQLVYENQSFFKKKLPDLHLFANDPRVIKAYKQFGSTHNDLISQQAYLLDDKTPTEYKERFWHLLK